MASNTVKVTLLADARGFQKGMKAAEDSTTGFQKTASTFVKAVQGFFALQAVQAVTQFVAASITAFSELEQSTGAVEAVFGEMADSITASSQTAADEYGLSARAFQESAALIGSQLKAQGFETDEAAVKTEELIGKAADLAATFGGPTSDAVAAIGALMRGETEQIEKYGGSMKQADIEARAMALGLGKTRAELDKNDKAVAALDLLYEQTADTMGQFGDEADTVAGKLERAKANAENMRAEIGEKLAPAFTSVMDAITGLQPVLESLISALDGATTATQPLIDELTTLAGITPESGVGLESVGDAIAHTIIPFLDPVTAGFHNINEVLGLNQKAAEDAVRAMEDERTHGLQPLAAATEDVTEAVYDHIGALQAQRDEQRANVDPTFALAEATRDLEAAQAEAAAVALEYTEGSPEHIAALDKVRDAAYDLKDAEAAVAEQGGTTTEAMRTHLRSLGAYTETEIGLIIADLERINAFQFNAKTIRITHQVTGGGFQERQHGGPVSTGTPYLVGERGPETFVPAAAGRIVPTHRLNGHGAAPVYNVTINAGMGSDPNGIAKAVVQALQQWERANGAIPVRTLR